MQLSSVQPARDRIDWRPWLRRKIAWLLAAKLAALLIMKALFFSGDSRPEISPDAVEQRMTAEGTARPVESPRD